MNQLYFKSNKNSHEQNQNSNLPVGKANYNRLLKINFTVPKLFVFVLISTFIITSCETNIFGPNEGTVTGSIKDIHNKPVKGATVKITYFETNKDGNQTEKSITRASDSAGFYIAEVPLAEIGVLITKNGYEEVLFYDYLEQDDPKRSFSTVLQGNPSGSSLTVLNNPFRVLVNDTMSLRVNITDNYKFKKQEPYYISLILKSDSILKRSYTIEVPYFSSSFKVVNNKIKIPAYEDGDTLKPGSYQINALIYDSDNLESDTVKAAFRVE